MVTVAADSPEPGERPGAESGRKILGRGAWIFTGRLFGALLAYVTQIALARWIGKDPLGVYVHAFALTILLTNLAMLGLNASAMRFLNEPGLGGQRDGLAWGFMGFAARAAMATALGIVAVGAAVVWFAVSAEHRWVYGLALLCVPVYTLMRLQGQFAHAQSWFGLWMVPNTVARPTALLAVTAACFALGWVTSAAAVMVVHLAVIAAVLVPQAVLFGRAIRRRVPAAEPMYRRGLWIRTSLPLLLVTAFGVLYPELNIVLVGNWMSDGDVAVFSAAYKTAVFLGFVVAAIDGAILPGVARLHAAGDRDGVQRVLDHATRIKLAVTGAGIVAMWLVGPYLLRLFGRDFAGGTDVLTILAATQLARAALGPAAEILGITGHQKLCVTVYAFGLVGTVAGHALLTPWLGLMGAALTVLGVIVVTGWVLSKVAHRQLGLRSGMRVFAR